jgi:hypothetical protein
VNSDIDERLDRIERMIARVLEIFEQRSRPRDADDMRVLIALASFVGDRRFSAAEVIRHARLAPGLAAALEQADCESPRCLGRLFRRVEGRNVQGVMLRREGEDRRGIVWVLRVCVTTPGEARPWQS